MIRNKFGYSMVGLAAMMSIGGFLMLNFMKLMGNNFHAQRRITSLQELEVFDSTVKLLLSQEQECSAFIAPLKKSFFPVGNPYEVALPYLKIGSTKFAEAGKPADKGIDIKSIVLRHMPGTSSSAATLGGQPRIQWLAHLVIQLEYGNGKSKYPRSIEVPLVVLADPNANNRIKECSGTSSGGGTLVSAPGGGSGEMLAGFPETVSVSHPTNPLNYTVPAGKLFLIDRVAPTAGAQCKIDGNPLARGGNGNDEGGEGADILDGSLYLGSGVHSFSGKCAFMGLLALAGKLPAGRVISFTTNSATPNIYTVPPGKIFIFGGITAGLSVALCSVNDRTITTSYKAFSEIPFGDMPTYGFSAGAQITLRSVQGYTGAYTTCTLTGTLADAP